jgi:hypothetical protein
MTHTTEPISLLRQRMIKDMGLRKLSPNTQTSYIRHIREFTRFLGRSPDTANAEDLRRYQLHLVEQGIASGRRESGQRLVLGGQASPRELAGLGVADLGLGRPRTGRLLADLILDRYGAVRPATLFDSH